MSECSLVSEFETSLVLQSSPSNVSPQTHVVLSIVYDGPRSIHSPLILCEKVMQLQARKAVDHYLKIPSLYMLHWPES